MYQLSCNHGQMRAQQADIIGRWWFARSDIILHIFAIECRKPDLISCWCWNFITILVSQVRKKFHTKFSQCCWKCSVSSLLSIIFIRITERRWAIHLLSTGHGSWSYVRTNHGIFTWIFQWQTRLRWAMTPRSPNLILLDFSLWGHLKNKISATPPATIDKLKWRITTEIQNITQKMLRKVFQIWWVMLLRLKISIDCIFSICYSL